MAQSWSCRLLVECVMLRIVARGLRADQSPAVNCQFSIFSAKLLGALTGRTHTRPGWMSKLTSGFRPSSGWDVVFVLFCLQ